MLASPLLSGIVQMGKEALRGDTFVGNHRSGPESDRAEFDERQDWERRPAVGADARKSGWKSLAFVSSAFFTRSKSAGVALPKR